MPKPQLPKFNEFPGEVAASLGKLRLPDGTKSFKSRFVWRGMFLMSVVAAGLCIVLLVGNHTLFAALWAIIAIGWFSISMWLWRQNVRYMDG